MVFFRGTLVTAVFYGFYHKVSMTAQSKFCCHFTRPDLKAVFGPHRFKIYFKLHYFMLLGIQIQNIQQ